MENVLKICKHLFFALSEEACEGEIIYIDHNELDVDSANGIIRIFSDGVLRPYSCLVPSTVNFASLGLILGGKVFLGPEEIDLNSGDTVFSLKMSEKTDLSCNALGLFLPIDLKQRFRYLQRAVELSSNAGCFQDLLLSSESVPYSMDGLLTHLTEAVKREELEAICEAAKNCSGLGNGRYPASDSLLCGFMQAYAAFSCAMGRNWEHVRQINLAVLKGAALNTSRDSGFMLWLASNGLSDEQGCYLFRCLLSDKSYPNLLGAATSAVSQNGSDWMIGICSFLRFFAF